MSGHTNGVVLLRGPRRGTIKPILRWAFVATIVEVIRRIARQPSLPRMSDQWLQSRQPDFSRDQVLAG